MDITLILLLLGVGALLASTLADDGGDDQDDEIRGTFDDDTINGTDGDDVIRSWRGADTIFAGGGEDFVNAGLDDDTVFGGDARDIIEGRAGNDRLFGEAGNDTFLGGAGDDYLDGGPGFDIIRAGRGDDILIGGAAGGIDAEGNFVTTETVGDLLRGEGGDDTVFLWGKQGTAIGGGDEDTLVLVTGQGRLEDEDGETDFVILANATDEAIPTRGTITEFNPNQDTLTLTVDAPLAPGAPLPEVDFTLEERTVLEGTREVNSVFVLAKIADGQPAVDDSEAAGVFLRGASLDLLEGADIEVVFTNGADYFDPQSTLADVIAARPTPVT